MKKKAIKIILGILTILAIIALTIISINNDWAGKIRGMSIFTSCDYNNSEQRAKEIETKMSALSKTNYDAQQGQNKSSEDMTKNISGGVGVNQTIGEVEGLPPVEVSVELKKDNEIMNTQTVYPIIYGTKIYALVTVKNLSDIQSVNNLQVKYWQGEANQIANMKYKQVDVSDEDPETKRKIPRNIKPGDTYKVEVPLVAYKPYLEIAVSANNTETFNSGIYRLAIIGTSRVDVVNIEHNLPENPLGVVYEDDTLQGEFLIYSEQGFKTERKEKKLSKDRPVEYKGILEITIELPKGISINNLVYTDPRGTYTPSETENLKFEYYINNKTDKQVIKLTFTSLKKRELTYLRFDYTINKGCENYVLEANVDIPVKWKFIEREFISKDEETYEESYYHQHEEGCSGLGEDGYHTVYATDIASWNKGWEEKEFGPWKYGSGTFNYIVGHPVITIKEKTPYELETGDASKVTEGELLVYEFEIENSGNAPVIELKLTQKIDPNLAIVAVQCNNQGGQMDMGKFIKDGQMTVDIGRLNNNRKITIKIITRSKILTNLEEKLVVKNQAILEGKKIDPIITNNEEITIERSEKVNRVEQMTREERNRLEESWAICDAIGETYAIRFDDYGKTSKPVGNKQLETYCVESGGSVRIRYYDGQLITHQMVQHWVATDSIKTRGCGCANNVAHYMTHWQCVKRHFTESSSNYRNSRTGARPSNLYEIGFIVSWTPKWTDEWSTGWSREQQQALWQSVINEGGSSSYVANRAEGKRLLTIATNYKDFWQKIMEDEAAQKTSLRPKSLIEYETATDKNEEKAPEEGKERRRLEVSVNQEEELIRVGPFKLDYVEGRYETDDLKYSFGGISDMYLLDAENNRINIENIVKEQEGVFKVDYTGSEDVGSKTFFSIYEPGTSNTDGNTTDWHDSEKTYPRAGEEFYIEIKTKYDFNQDGVVDANDYIPASLRLKVEFQWMRSKTSICIRDGKYYYEDQDHSDIPHTHWKGRSCHSCTKIPKMAESSGDQEMLYILAQERLILKENLIIPIGDGTIQTTLKLGGFVFQDQLQGKENKQDGLKQENDLNLKNIEVALYDVETDELVPLKTLKQERPDVEAQEGAEAIVGATQEEIDDANDYTRRTNPTLTDANGYYEFRGVPIGKKYYVKFTYNGQTYLPTDYMVNCDITKLNEPNSTYGDTEEWRKASKGTERQTERTAFDEMYKSIGSSPRNYVSKNNLEKLTDESYNETFSNYELAGFYLDSEGSYQQDEEKQLIDTYVKLEDKDGHLFMVDTSDPLYEGEPELREGLISKAIKNYIDNKDIDGNALEGEGNNAGHLYPTDEVMRDVIYTGIVEKLAKTKEDEERYWKMLQFIEDCQTSSYTKKIEVEEIEEFDLYPYPDLYTTFVSAGQMYPNNSYELVDPSGTTNLEYDNRGTYADGISEYENLTYTANGKTNQMEYTENSPGIGQRTFNNIYPGHLFINQGLVVRQNADMSLRKDVYRATLQINGKTEVYQYDTRKQLTAEQKKKLQELNKNKHNDLDSYLAYQNYKEELERNALGIWDIQAKMIDYKDYYDEAYNRELYESDFNFPGDINGENELEAYITYKISIANQSDSFLTIIDEIVDYYDDTYEFQPDKSWMMYYEGNIANKEPNENDITVPDQDYYDIMVGDRQIGGKYRAISAKQRGGYGAPADFINEFKGEGYKTLYIDSLKGKKLQSGEEEYLYLTFKVNGQGSGLSIEGGDTEPGKQNIVEINGYSTFYKDGTELPNGITISGDDTTCGKIDQDSDPGNFRAKNLSPENNRYEQNFEDDTDRARGLRVFVKEPENNEEMVRIVSGNAWEDNRNVQIGDAIVGNGIREKGELPIEGIQVQLLEVLVDDNSTPSFDQNGDAISTKPTKIYNGSTFVDAVTTTDKNGQYRFEGIVPGDYIVRFTYGGEFNAFYNGQDYKTTSYQVGIDQNGRTDVSKPEDGGYVGYTNVGTYDDKGNNYAQNASGTYGYDIQKADLNQKGNVSDAKDLWRIRAQVNAYSSSDSQNQAYKGVTYEKANTLNKNREPNKNTQMIADTGVIRAEFEYNRENTKANTWVDENGNTEILDNNGYKGTDTGRDSYTGQNNSSKNNQNGTYHIQNVDLGLEERPKAALELNKKITNIRMILANQTELFDANGAMNDLTWKDKVAYKIQQYRKEMKNNMYEYYGKGVYDKFRDMVQTHVNSLVNNDKGLMVITMDEEVMHGATIQITYDMTVTNVGEVDYRETQFYYNASNEQANKPGIANASQNIVKTSADVVLDYVSNNLKFETRRNNSSWQDVTKNVKSDNNAVNYELNFDIDAKGNGEGDGRAKTKEILNKYNTIIQTSKVSDLETGLGKALIPAKTSTMNAEKIENLNACQTSTKLVLNQIITAQNTQDEKCYNNIAEIVKISNDVGRRMAYSVQGNQNPRVATLDDKTAHLEMDSSMSEEVKILPPFGVGNVVVYIALTLAVVVILAGGIILIKKKILK